MSKNYTKLSLIQRYQIEALVKTRMKQKMIAANIRVDLSTVSRELAKTSLKEEEEPVNMLLPMHSVKRIKGSTLILKL